MSDSAVRLSGFARHLATTLASWAGVLLGAAAALQGLQWLGGALANDPSRVLAVASIDAAQRRIGHGLLTPSFFPSRLSWPPRGVRVVQGPPEAVLLDITGRESRTTEVLMLQTLGARPRSMPDLLPEGVVTTEQGVDVDGEPGRLLERQLRDGERWRELSWRDGGWHVVLRYRDMDDDQMLRMAKSLRRGRL